MPRRPPPPVYLMIFHLVACFASLGDAFIAAPSLAQQYKAVDSKSVSRQPSLVSFLVEEQDCEAGLVLTLHSLSLALKAISQCVRTSSLRKLTGLAGTSVNVQGEKQKKLDVVANDLLVNTLSTCQHVSVLASEEEEEPICLPGKGVGSGYCVVFDPLDGSSNIDAAIPTGTIFGIYHTLGEGPEAALETVLQPGRKLVAAGYCLYGGATELVLTLGGGKGTHVLTLDPGLGEFILTRKHVCIPPRGRTYSLNEAREVDWPEGLRCYIRDMKTGRGQSRTPYDLVYICSLVADVHWVLLRGGMASNPRSHLRLVYEGNPMALLVEEAGGLASSGRQPILDVHPDKVHQRLPLFVGSREDIQELLSYGEVQQLENPGYEV